MAKKKKLNLKQALKKVDSLPDKFFGKINVDLSTLPCLKKVSREKITANFDSDVLEALGIWPRNTMYLKRCVVPADLSVNGGPIKTDIICENNFKTRRES